MATEVTMQDVRQMLATETGLVEVITLRKSGRPLVSVVNAGVVPHPETGRDVVAFVSRGPAVRLKHLRQNGEITVAIRRGWEWIAVDGTTELAGPRDSHSAVPESDLPRLLRQIYQAAGGTHDDYNEYDQAMVEDQRCAVFVSPTRIYSNKR